MKIFLTPSRVDEQLHAEVNGDIIVLNGVSFDFSPLLEGCRLPFGSISSTWITGDVFRTDGEIVITLVLPHGSSAPNDTRFPDALVNPISIASGVVPLPPYNTIESEEEAGEI